MVVASRTALLIVLSRHQEGAHRLQTVASELHAVTR